MITELIEQDNKLSDLINHPDHFMYLRLIIYILYFISVTFVKKIKLFILNCNQI